MVTVACAGLPSDTPVGSVPNSSSTLSLSSSTVSAVAANVNVCSVSPDAKVTLVGATL